MQVICPHCLQQLKLKRGAPGRYTFRCSNCNEPASVEVPEDPDERAVARPIRTERPGESTKDRAPQRDDRVRSPKPAAASQDADTKLRTPEVRKSRPVRKVPEPVDSFEEEVEDRSQRSARRASASDDEFADDWELPEYEGRSQLPARVKKKKPKPKKEPTSTRPRKKRSDVAQWLVVGLVAGAIWLTLIVVAVFFRPATYGIFALGGVVAIVGRSMFMRVAREEGSGTVFACRFIPFYSAYFFITHLDETIRPFLIYICGVVVLISGAIIWNVWKFTEGIHPNLAHRAAAAVDDDEDAKPQSPEAKEYARVAQAFGDALIKGDYETVRTLGSSHLSTKFSAEQLAEAEDKSIKELGKPIKINHVDNIDTDPNVLAGPNHAVAGESPAEAAVRQVAARRAVGDLPDTVPIDIRKASVQMEVQRDPRTIPDFEKKSGKKIEDLTPDDQPVTYLIVVLVKENGRIAVAHYFHRQHDVLD